MYCCVTSVICSVPLSRIVDTSSEVKSKYTGKQCNVLLCGLKYISCSGSCKCQRALITVAYVRCVHERFLMVQYISVHLTIDNMAKKRIAVWIRKVNVDS